MVPQIPNLQPVAPGARSSARLLPALGIFAAYFFLALLLTWPLAPRMLTHVPMGENDLWQNYWNLWWWKTALWERHQSPYHTDLLYYPGGAPLGCHTHSEANMLWTLPINLLLGIPAALNAAVLAGFIFAACGAYLLARLYAPGRGAAFLAGLVFAYFPQHVEQSLEHLNLASFQAMPFFLWALARLIRRGGPAGWLLAGSFGALNALFAWHNGLLIIPAAALLAIYESWKRPRPLLSIFLDLLKAAALALLLVLPYLWPVLREVWQGAAALKKEPLPKAIDPLFLFIPHPGQPLWGKAVSGFYIRFQSYPSVGSLAYLGAAALALASASPVRSRRSSAPGLGEPPASRRPVWPWLFLFLFSLLLSFGETLHLASVEISWLPMPFHWLKHIPIFGLVRIANRFLVPAALALAVLAAMGGGALASFLPRPWRGAFFALAAALLILDYLWIPYPLRTVPRPEWLPRLEEALAQVPAGRAVLDLPSGHLARASADMLLQTWHRRPITGGYLAATLRRVEETLQRFPVLRRIFQRYPPPEAYQGPALAEAVRALQVGVVVVHLDRAVEKINERRKRLQDEFPSDPYRHRLENPDKGIETAALDFFRGELRRSFGEPVYILKDQVEIFVVR